jgi:regulator of chromosome condensation
MYEEDKLMKELLQEHDNKLSNFVAESAPIVDIFAGGKHSLVLTGSGSLYTFGFGDQGQLGLRNTDNAKRPTLVTDFENVRIQSISAGSHHSIVQTAKGDLYSCGLNKDG